MIRLGSSWRGDQTLTRGQIVGLSWAAVGRNVSSVFYFVLLEVVSLLPWHVASRLAARLGRWRAARAREVSGRAALAAYRLGASRETAEAWLRRAYELATLDDLACCQYGRLSRASLSRVVEVVGLEHLDRALDRGRGAILFTGHFKGIFTLFVALGVLGYRVDVFRAQRLPQRYNVVERWFYDRRMTLLERKLRCTFLWTQSPNPWSAAQAALALKRGDVVVVLVDARGGSQRVEASFLGGYSDFPAGSVDLAKVSGAPLLGVHLTRPDLVAPLRVRIDPPLPPSPDRAEIVQLQATFLETAIRADPAMWSAMLFKV